MYHVPLAINIMLRYGPAFTFLSCTFFARGQHFLPIIITACPVPPYSLSLRFFLSLSFLQKYPYQFQRHDHHSILQQQTHLLPTSHMNTHSDRNSSSNHIIIIIIHNVLFYSERKESLMPCKKEIFSFGLFLFLYFSSCLFFTLCSGPAAVVVHHHQAILILFPCRVAKEEENVTISAFSSLSLSLPPFFQFLCSGKTLYRK